VAPLDFTEYDRLVNLFRGGSPNIAKAFDENKKLVKQLEGSPPPPPPPPDYPVSFFTGPLGVRNVVPANSGGVLVGLWTGVKGNSEDQQRQLIQQRMSDCGRNFDFIQFQDTQLSVAGSSAEDWINSKGAVPVHVWNTGSSLDAVLNGSQNAKIDAVADKFKSKSYRVIIRLMHEFDLSHVPYFPGASGGPKFVQAWRYIVDRIKARGASNIGYWWCPTEQGGGLRPMINAAYPGDIYVDWVGSDVYNNVGGWSTPIKEGWATPNELIGYDKLGGPASTQSMFGVAKPYVVGETGSRSGDGRSGQPPVVTSAKGDWHRQWDAAKTACPNLKGVGFFDTNTGTDEWNNWRVDTLQSYAQYVAQNLGAVDANPYQGFKDLVATARWKVGVAP
jgi:hypothetical protein